MTEVPEGWKLVPITPTRKMINRGYARRPVEECWRVMLEASPVPPHQSAPEPMTYTLCACGLETWGRCVDMGCPDAKESKQQGRKKP